MRSEPPPKANAAPAEREARRNFRLGVLNGVLFTAGEGAIDPSTVVALFVSRLTTSNTLIGFATGLSDFGWLAPQIFFARWAARFPRQMPLYVRAATVRGLGLALIAALAWPLRDHPAAMLVAFFVGYGTYALGAGVGAVAFMEIVGRTVPPARLTPFWSARLFIGGILAFGMAAGVRVLLDRADPGAAFAILFGVATVLSALGWVAFARIREPAHAPRHDVPGGLGLLRRGVGMLRTDPTFRRLLVARTVLNLWLSASPFVVLFAVRDLGGGARAAGTFLIARVLGFVLGNLVWPPLARAHGNRALMVAGTLGCGAIATLAFAIGVLSPWGAGVIGGTAAAIALETLAFFAGAVHSALNVGYASLSIELAPAGERQPYVSLLNTFVGPTMLLPAVGGLLVDVANAPALFAIVGVLAFASVRSAARLPGPRELAAHAATPGPGPEVQT
jgi:hypothetical protein